MDRAAGGTHAAEGPAKRYRASMIGSNAGWHCRVTSHWTLFKCPWSGKQESDCDTPKHSMRAGGYIRHGEASRRATATRPNTVCELLVTKRETGREAAGMCGLSGMDKDVLVPSAPRNGHSIVLSFASDFNT